MKKAIFTVLIGNYDFIQKAPIQKGWDSFLFTDQNVIDSKGWNVLPVKESDNPKKESRRFKILSHLYLAEYDLVCYIDANYKVIGKLPEKPLRFVHPTRSTIKEEAKRIIRYNKDNSGIVLSYLNYLNIEGFKDTQLLQNGFFIRRHDLQTNKLHEYWFSVIEQYSYRDQLSLPYAVWKTGIKLENILPNQNHTIYFKKASEHLCKSII